MNFEDAFDGRENGPVKVKKGLANVNLIVTASRISKLVSIDQLYQVDKVNQTSGEHLFIVHHYGKFIDNVMIKTFATSEPSKYFVHINGEQYLRTYDGLRKIFQLQCYRLIAKGVTTINGNSRGTYIIEDCELIEVVPKPNSMIAIPIKREWLTK